MRINKFMLGLCILFSLVLFSSIASALIGCCCDPVVFNGTFEDSSSCSAKSFIFAGVPSPGKTCSEYCNATRGIPSVVQNITSPAGCGVPGYSIPVTGVVVSPVKGDRKMRISFSLPCAADYVNIYRCKGVSCSDFSSIDTFSGASYVDESGLEFGVTYNYKISAHYTRGSDSDPAFGSGSLGDLECWNHVDDSEFCISQYSYDWFKNYLQSFGYKSSSASSFLNSFVSSVSSSFGSRFNKAWSCNANNVLFQRQDAVSCPSNQVCVSGVSRARCVSPGSCEQGGAFGLFSSESSCESEDYCFFDRSKTNVDYCFECSQRMSCYNYNSENACEKDTCGIGNCEWKDVFPLLGVGVCIDERFDNCPLCSQTPPTSIPNSVGFNKLYDSCSPAKADTLSTPTQECFFNKNVMSAAGCSEAVCDDFSKSQCGSPSGGIQLSADNSVLVSSSDSCGIGLCYYSDSEGRCFKDADANQVADCEDRVCEKDYFAPLTSVFVTGSNDFLQFLVSDKISRAAAGTDVTDTDGYLTFACVGECADVSSFILVNSSRLIINDLSLEEEDRVLFALANGSNTFKFFSVDPNRNVEQVRSITFSACSHCAGPKILNFYSSRANKIGDNYYTNAPRPIFRVRFSKPAVIVAARLSSGGGGFSFSAEPSSGFSRDYVLSPLVDLVDGVYSVSLNAQSEDNLFMNSPLEFNLTVDTVYPDVVLRPVNNSFFSSNSVNVSITVSEDVLINSSIDDIMFVNNYAVKRSPSDLKDVLSSSDNRTFSGLAKSLSSGKKALHALVSDFAGNKVVADSFFYITTGAPDFRLQSPNFGITPVYSFDVVVESSGKAECRYLYDVSASPPTSQFSYLSLFDDTGDTEHVLRNVNIPEGDSSKHLLHVYCRGEGFSPIKKTFELMYDASVPNITSAFVYPSVISDFVSPEELRFSASLKVQTSEPTFCKYGYEQDYSLMTGLFPGFGDSLVISHITNISVDEEGQHVLYIGCEDITGLKTSVISVNFTVDSLAPFSVESVTERYQNSTPLALRVETNKKAFCYFGESENDISECFGDCSFGTSHVVSVSKQEFGDYPFFIKCNNGAGGMITDTLEIMVGFGISPEDPNEILAVTHCADSVLSGTETDVDCGGACEACGFGQTCLEDSDCSVDLFCVRNVCGGMDSDNDGISDDSDICPDTPEGEDVDSRGCSRNQLDADNDGMDDSWELRYGLDSSNPSDASEDLDSDGLSNLVEFQKGTNPADRDSDGDGWSDGAEVSKGFDPLNPDSHPKSVFSSVWPVLLIILIILGLAVIGYVVYSYIKSLPPSKAKISPPVSAPSSKDKLADLRDMVKLGPPKPKGEKEWISFSDLTERIKRKGGPTVWEKLNKIKESPKNVQEEKPAASKEDVIESLRKIAKKREEQNEE